MRGVTNNRESLAKMMAATTSANTPFFWSHSKSQQYTNRPTTEGELRVGQRKRDEGSTSHRGMEEMVDRRSRQGQATHSPMLRGLAIQSSRRGSNASAHRLLSRRQLIKTLRDDTARAGPPSSRRPQTPAPSPGVRLSHDPLPSFLSPHPVRAH